MNSAIEIEFLAMKTHEQIIPGNHPGRFRIELNVDARELTEISEQ